MESHWKPKGLTFNKDIIIEGVYPMMKWYEDPVYIKQCDCPEIQEQWNISDWDWVYCKHKKESVVLSGYEVDGGYYGHSSEPECDTPVSNGDFGRGLRIFKDEHIWLPRQDQLQAMADKPYQATKCRSAQITQLLMDATRLSREMCCTSIEQLWLAFVMLQLHYKE